MESIEFERRMRDLLARIEAMPEAERGPLYLLARESRARQNRIEAYKQQTEAALVELRQANAESRLKLAGLQSRLADLSLVAKLTLFDLEARRRERDADA